MCYCTVPCVVGGIQKVENKCRNEYKNRSEELDFKHLNKSNK